jgi:hypothetical protein
MKSNRKKLAQIANGRAIKLATQKTAKSAQPERTPVKSNTVSKMQHKKPATTIAEQYLRLFTSHPLANQDFHTENGSLEQPSELRYTHSTSSPYAEV